MGAFHFTNNHNKNPKKIQSIYQYLVNLEMTICELVAAFITHLLVEALYFLTFISKKTDPIYICDGDHFGHLD